MQKDIRLLGITVLFILVGVILGFFNSHSSATVRAQNTAVTPTLYCLAAGCPNTTPASASTTTSNTTTNVITVPTFPPSSPSIAISPVLSTSQPCHSASLSSSHAPAQKFGKGGKFGDKGGKGYGDNNKGDRGGFLEDIFRFLLVLIDLILKVVGSGGLSLPCSPAVSPSPAPATPSSNPVPISSAPVSPASTSAILSPTITLAPANPSATASSTTTGGIGTGPSSIFNGGPFGNTCNPGQLYCNGHVVTGGTNNTLYNCQPHNAPTVQQVCPGACKVNSSGNDSC